MSSSSEEDLSKFKEATDVKLFNDSLFCEGKAEISFTPPVKPSQRYLDAPDENRSDLKVTAGFQKHVATHLMKILDRSLDQDTVPKEMSTSEHDSNGNCTSNVSSKQPEGGIKLFGASAAFLASCNITPPPQTKRRKRGRKFACISSESEDDSSSNEADTSNTSYKDSSVKADSLGLRAETELSERFAACAVSSDWILNGDAVKGWAPPFNSKEPLQGEATPDLLKVVLYKREKSKKRCKKAKPLNEEPVLNKKRGKRGGSKKSKKKKVTEISLSGNGENPLDIADSLTTELKKSDPESRQAENNLENMEKQIARKYRKLKVLCKKFAREYAKEKGIEGALSVALHEKKKKRKKKKKKRREAELKPLWISKDDVKDTLKELQKKERKQGRREMRRDQLKLPVAAAAPAEDEGFDSDPTKTDKGKSEERNQLQSDKNGWQNNMEFLSVDLANLAMANVKQD